jgi:hypothetical protein
MADDDDISRRYRELPREEPPRHLDDAILAAARRAVHTRPAPLVVPSGRQRWYFPLAAAAIIVLAVAVTVHMEREQPAEEMLSSNTVTAPAGAREAAPPAPAVEPAAPARAPSAPAGAPSSQPRFEMRDEARAQKPQPAPSSDERARNEAAPAELQKAPTAKPQAVPPPPSTMSQDAFIAEQSAGAVTGRVEAEAKPAERAKAVVAAKGGAEVQRRFDEGARAASSLSAFALQSPEQWLQGIADLRKQGRHEEADRELAEFRKRHPDYRIPPTMRERVERR